MSDLRGFRHRTIVEVRFRDLDAMRHVNNAVYLSYLEHARLRYLRDVVGVATLKHLALVLATITCDYLSPVHMNETIEVGTRVDWIGNSSVAMSHEMLARADGRAVARASSVLVAYDYEAAHPQRVSEAWRRSFETYEGRSLERRAATVAG